MSDGAGSRARLRLFRSPALPPPRLRRLTQLYVGLLAYGLGLALVVAADLGAAPWDVLHQGLTHQFGLTIGIWNVLVAIVLMTLWVPLRQRAGIGTLTNALLVGVFFDLALWVLPEVDGLVLRWVWLVTGILVVGLATGCYIGAQLGPGPRDGIMTGLVDLGLSVRMARTGLEALVVTVGFLLGGTVGLGTLLFALLIGQVAHVFLPLLTIAEHHRGDVT